MPGWSCKCKLFAYSSMFAASMIDRLQAQHFQPLTSSQVLCIGPLTEPVCDLPYNLPYKLNICLSALRRHGAFRRDLNVELINPFTRNIAQTWSEVFESDLFGPFERDTIDTVNELVKDVEDSAAPGLKDRARLQGEASLEEARVALRKIVDLVKETMNQEQKEVSRCLAPHVQEQLIDGYDRAMEERGTGSVARQKVRCPSRGDSCITRIPQTYFRGYVDDRKDTMFDDGADVVLERLTKAADAIGETLDEAMGKLAEKVCSTPVFLG